MDPASMRAQLGRVPMGTRIRLFHRDGAERVATSGILRSIDDGELTLAPDGGGVLVVARAAVTCFYVPPQMASRTSAFASLRAALRRTGAG